MNLEDLRALVAVVETGSLANAAKRVHITQPAVTRRIQRLEADLGTALLDREQKPARLTAVGADVYRHALRMLQAAQDLRVSAAGPQTLEPIRIGVSYAVADTVLGLAVEAIQRAIPGVRLRLTADRSSALVERLSGRDLDAAVICTRSGQDIDGPFTVRELGREQVVVVAPRSHPGPSRTTLAAIARERWVINPNGCGFRAQLDRALLSEGSTLDLAVEAWGAELQLSLVARGAGLGLVPARIVATSPRRDLVRVLDVTDFHPELGVVLLADTTTGTVVTVRDALAEVIAREMHVKRSEAA